MTTTFSASTLAAKASAARDKQTQDRLATKQEKEKELARLMKEFVEYLLTTTPEQERLADLSEKGHCSTVVGSFHPPTTQTDASGDRCYVYPASSTHFSGYTEAEGLKDAESGGVPIMMLFQGPLPFSDRSGSRPKPDPALLAGGRTACDLLNAELLNMAGGKIEDALVVRSVWNGKERALQLHLIWDLGAWEMRQAKIREHFESKRAAWKEKHNSGAATAAAPELTLSELEAQKKQAKASKVSKPVTDAEGFSEVKARRQGKQRA